MISANHEKKVTSRSAVFKVLQKLRSNDTRDNRQIPAISVVLMVSNYSTRKFIGSFLNVTN